MRSSRLGDMKEWRSKLENLMPAVELRFPPTPGFRPFQRYFADESVQHPAKANVLLLYYLIKKHTNEGDVVLDPMAGTSSTGIIASLLGRHSVCVELEEKFVEWSKKNVECLEKSGRKRGEIRVIQGDARRLSQLLSQADAAITSPPYSEILGASHRSKLGDVKKQGSSYQKFGEQPTEKEFRKAMEKGFSCKNRQAGWMRNLRKALKDPSKSAWKGFVEGYSESKENIGNLPFIDTVITSPPYGDTNNRKSRKMDSTRGIRNRAFDLPENERNIGNLKVDSIITSPPYEGSLEGTTRHTRGGIASRDPALAQTGTYSEISPTIARLRKHGRTNPKQGGPYGRSLAHPYTEFPTVMSFGVPVGYSPNKENIGNLKSSEEEYKALADAVITSPPYAHESTASKETRLEKQGLFKMGHSKEQPYTEDDYRKWDKHREGNIGKRKLFIRVPCSPEEAQFHDTRPGRKGTIWEWTKEVEATPEIIEKIQKLKSEKKGKSETYLEAMLKVYAEMYRVLKPGGLAIIIVKPFIRNKRVVDLPWHTYLLMHKVGFTLEKLYKLRLKQSSFWRILYAKRFSEVPRIHHEYILLCKKP